MLHVLGKKVLSAYIPLDILFSPYEIFQFSELMNCGFSSVNHQS